MDQDVFDELLLKFAESFYGYGSASKYWFIGMEEHGGHTVDDVYSRLQAWHIRGENELEDVADYHHAIGKSDRFSARPRLSKTWSKLIRILLAVKGSTPTKEDVRLFQRDDFARYGGDNCSLELLPLPSPNTATWLYDRYSSLPVLRSRSTYQDHYMPKRVDHLRARIDEHHPSMVIFYGTTYMEEWKKIARTDFDVIAIGRKKCYMKQVGNTLFAVTVHPTNEWSNKYYESVGSEINRRLGETTSFELLS